MTHSGSTGSRRRIPALLAAVAFALLLVVAPPAVRPALAASDLLRTEAAATYTLDPADGRVHVRIDLTMTDLKPNTPDFIYYYDAFGFALQAEASSVRVSGGTSDGVTTRKRDGYTEAVVTLNRRLLYRQSTSFTIRYDLVGGEPRSETPTRVGAAYSTFGVWAWGDPGRGTVEVRTPAGFDTRFNGDTMQVTSSPTTGQILRAEPADPATFFTIVTAEDDAAYTETRVSLDGGVEIVVESWPEDAAWKASVTDTLRLAMPELRALIGLDWPVAHDLDVRERYTPDLEGYAGFFQTEEERIEVSEDLDPGVIVHEASHAWFNDALFVDRWIYEGLAEEYAWRAMTAAGIEPDALPDVPELADPGWQALIQWRFPRVIRDQDTEDEEEYGYRASFWVVHEVVVAVGVERMMAAFAAAEANHTAYPGAGAPELVAPTDDWRRFLDLVEPLDTADPASLDAAFGDYVMTTPEAQQFALRAKARAAYRALLEAGDGWLPPWAVRSVMGTWSFTAATTAMAGAMDVLAQRDEVAAAANALGLRPDGALRAAYEGATDAFTGATAIADQQLAALTAIAEAKAQVEAPPDLVARIGLLGATPGAAYDDARAAFETGELDVAITQADLASSIVVGAAAVGQQRLLVAAIVTGGAILLLVLGVALLRRRRRSRALALATGPVAPPPAETTAVATGPVAPPPAEPPAAPVEPYATLAADPAPDPDEGGQAPR
jgi:hypothetical protein